MQTFGKIMWYKHDIGEGVGETIEIFVQYFDPFAKLAAN